MSKNTTRILARIKALELERMKLLPLRKEEIFNVLDAAGGIALDNRLLAGLAIYAANPDNAGSKLLRELSELGQKKMPSRRIRTRAKEKDTTDAVPPNANTEGQAHG